MYPFRVILCLSYQFFVGLITVSVTGRETRACVILAGNVVSCLAGVLVRDRGGSRITSKAN